MLQPIRFRNCVRIYQSDPFALVHRFHTDIVVRGKAFLFIESRNLCRRVAPDNSLNGIVTAGIINNNDCVYWIGLSIHSREASLKKLVAVPVDDDRGNLCTIYNFQSFLYRPSRLNLSPKELSD